MPRWTASIGLGRVLGLKEGLYEPPLGYVYGLPQGLLAGWSLLDGTIGSGATGQQGPAGGGPVVIAGVRLLMIDLLWRDLLCTAIPPRFPSRFLGFSSLGS